MVAKASFNLGVYEVNLFSDLRTILVVLIPIVIELLRRPQ
jgi:hypothetical protein